MAARCRLCQPVGNCLTRIHGGRLSSKQASQFSCRNKAAVSGPHLTVRSSGPLRYVLTIRTFAPVFLAIDCEIQWSHFNAIWCRFETHLSLPGSPKSGAVGSTACGPGFGPFGVLTQPLGSSPNSGMAYAHNYSRYNAPPDNQTSSIHMTTTFSHPFLSKSDRPASPDANRKFNPIEPLLAVGSCLFWLAVLPLNGLLCAGVIVFDKIASLEIRPLRLPDLRFSAAHNPLVLRKNSEPKQSRTVAVGSAVQSLQS